jgi:hypothetical protein
LLLVVIVAGAGTVVAQFRDLSDLLPRPDLQKPGQFTIKISAPQEAKLGDPLPLQVTLTNTGKEDFATYRDATRRAEYFYKITVHDALGREPALTELHRTFRGDGTGIILSNDIPILLEPGKSLQDETDISTLYKIDQPGKYTIQVDRFNGTDKPRVKSNTITVSIVPHHNL